MADLPSNTCVPRTLSGLKGKPIFVKLVGGRELEGTIINFDQHMNLVLDMVNEFVRDPEQPSTRLQKDGKDAMRELGLVVVRGQSISAIFPQDGSEEIANPWADDEEEA